MEDINKVQVGDTEYTFEARVLTNPLTIGNVEYDGSSAVKIDINTDGSVSNDDIVTEYSEATENTKIAYSMSTDEYSLVESYELESLKEDFTELGLKNVDGLLCVEMEG